MSLLIESIKIKNQRVRHIDYHQRRFDRARLELFGSLSRIRLRNSIDTQDLLPHKTYKCRITYNQKIRHVEYEEYELRPIKKLKLISVTNLSYHYKYQDRQQINNLFKQRGDADDILLCIDGYIADTSYANVALYDGHEWHTPKRPLLKGTARARYLAKGLIVEKDILMEDLDDFQKLRVFNAMIGFGDVEIADLQCINKATQKANL